MAMFDPRTVRSAPTHPPYAAQQTLPGPVPPPPRPPRPRRSLAVKIAAGVVAAGLVAGGAGAWMALSGSATETAAVQSTSFAGADPTASPFGTDAPQVATVAATGSQAGDTTGLYAATTPPACTTADYLSQLQADPAKLAAFGGVFGLGAGDVPAFVTSLSPVVLRAATSVTDHPFADGAFVEQPAVLVPGTAVLVNSYGEPTVKCFNGNPLTAGAPATDAVTVTPTSQAMTQFRFSTLDDSGTVVVPAPRDPKPHPGPNPVTARYNYDGSVLLSDGRIVKADGTVISPKAPLPAGGVRNADGSVTVGGKTFNPDGTERTAIVIPPQIIQLPLGGTTTVPGFTIRADGVAVDGNNTPLTPQPTVLRNYDGTATVISGGEVDVWGTDGSFRSKFQVVPPNKVNPDGSITTPDGSILNPDGSTKRTPVTLPDHETVHPNGGEPTGDPKTTTATGGQAQPGPVTQPCPDVVADAATACKLPTGSADSAGSKKSSTPAGSGTDSTSTSAGSTSGTGSTTGTGTTSTGSSSGSGSTKTDPGSGTSKNTTNGGSKY